MKRIMILLALAALMSCSKSDDELPVPEVKHNCKYELVGNQEQYSIQFLDSTKTLDSAIVSNGWTYNFTCTGDVKMYLDAIAMIPNPDTLEVKILVDDILVLHYIAMNGEHAVVAYPALILK